MPDGAAPSTGARSSLNLLSEDGLRLARTLLRPLVPFDIHDYQLEGACALVQGTDLLACLPTGSGKTAFFYLPLLLSTALKKCTRLPESQRARFPANPALLAVLPKNSLEFEKETELQSLGVSTIVINADTQSAALRRGEDLWVTVQRKHISAVLLAPEQLIYKGFERLINDAGFTQRLCFLDIDEVHLLDKWGANFRKAFLEIGYVRACLPEQVRLVALTATLLDGERKHRVLRFLGLKPGQFHCIHRSNMRYDIQPIIRTLSVGLGGRRFPDLDWVLRRNRKTIIFCKTILLSFRVLVYLWHRAPVSPSRSTRIRMYNSLNSPAFNAKTQRLMHMPHSDLQIVIATATLAQGSNAPDIQDFIIVGDLEDPDDFVQQIGRAGRDRRLVSDARGILYITPGARETARAVLGLPTTKKTPVSASKMHLGVARLLLATCLREEQDSLYKNPIDDAPCPCTSCASNPPLPKPAHCSCS
ncbi:P-loop containing nucleoside triphosphate hydrolase protein, partial [Auriscalpium vulgare]